MNKEETKSRLNNFYKFNDIIFIVSSVIFNLAVSGVYIAAKIDAVKIDSSVLLKIFGNTTVLLIIPFTITLVGYIKIKAKKKIIISNIIILCYLFLEVMLDYVLKIPFREILALHVPYIIVFYAAAFSMIGVARTISKKMGLLVLSTFLVLIGCLIYMFLG